MKLDLQSIFDALLEGLVVLDEADRVVVSNSEARRLLDVPLDSDGAERLPELLGETHPLCGIVARVRASGRAAIHDEVELPRRLAAPIPVDVLASPLVDSDASDARSGLAIALRDRSAARSLHEEIRERERQESYGHIAAGIAHEVKNPLGGIRGAAELLALSAPDDRAKKSADLIVAEVDRISGLVDELMVFARGDILERTRVNVHQALDRLLDLLELERGYETIELVRNFDPSLPEIVADPARLQQIFLNLARNAMQAMEETGGRLTLTTRMSLDHRLVGPDGRPRQTIEIQFEDTGPGIPADLQHRLSTPFFTTRPKGTGLGLAVARHWAGRHDGRLRIESHEGAGTRVTVDLPLEPLSTTWEGARDGTASPDASAEGRS